MWQIISSYISVLIMMIGVYIFGIIVFEDNWHINNNIKKILYLLLISIPQTAIFLNFSGMEKSILMSFINVYFYKISFNKNYQKIILITILYMIILIIPEFIEMFFLTYIMRLSKDFCFNQFAGSIPSNIIIFILFFTIILIFKKLLRKIVNFEMDNIIKIVILSFLTFVCIGTFFYEMGKNFTINQHFLIYILVIIVLVSSMISYIKQSIINNKITKEYDQLLGFMQTYEEEVETQRTLRHETKNEFLAIRAKICDKEKESEIINYIDEILGDTYSVKKEKYAKFGYLPANGIKGLCYFKVQKAEELGIKVSINISKKIKNSTVFDLDLKKQREFAKILGVFIDNAIEASADSRDKELGIEAYSNLENEFRMIISNTYNNEIDEEKIGKENFTTKGKNRGHGLLLVNEIVKNNTIFETKRNAKNDIYSQTIIVKKSTCN